MNLSEAIDDVIDNKKNEPSFTHTENGELAVDKTMSACVDFIGRAGAMRIYSDKTIISLFKDAWKENSTYALRLLFYVRDFRDNHGMGERHIFQVILKYLADEYPKVVTNNLWAISEFGYSKDLYCLIGTKCEDAMWSYMKTQFELDYLNMKNNGHVSLLAKWIATPDASSRHTRKLGIMTARHMGYNHRTMREYKKKLRALRKYLDLPEIKMSANQWDKIEYSKCASRAILFHKDAFRRHDSERWEEYLYNVNKGIEKIHTGQLNPVEVINRYWLNSEDLDKPDSDLEVIWNNLPPLVQDNANVLVVADTSGSMFSSQYGSVRPIAASVGLAIYFAKNLHGVLKNKFMTFSMEPEFISFDDQDDLSDMISKVKNANWDYNTNIESAFILLLNTALKYHISQEDMPKAIMIISDMQFDRSVYSAYDDEDRNLFTDKMRKLYTEYNYKLPHIIYWNVTGSPTFHAFSDTENVSMVSGYSPNVFNQMISSINATPMQYVLDIVNDPRYEDIVVINNDLEK
jgi:hypothetical protein